MISQSEYRKFRGEGLRAVIDDGELPELPDVWHDVAPGTHIVDEDDMPEPSSQRTVSPRTLVVALAIVGIAIGGLIVLISLT